MSVSSRERHTTTRSTQNIKRPSPILSCHGNAQRRACVHLSVWVKLCMNSNLSRLCPTDLHAHVRVRHQVAPNHCRSLLISCRTGGDSFPEVNLLEKIKQIRGFLFGVGSNQNGTLDLAGFREVSKDWTKDLSFNPFPTRHFLCSKNPEGWGGGEGAHFAAHSKNPVTLLRINSSNVFLKACPKMSLLTNFGVHMETIIYVLRRFIAFKFLTWNPCSKIYKLVPGPFLKVNKKIIFSESLLKTKSSDTILGAMEIVLPKSRSLKHEKERETRIVTRTRNKNCHQNAIERKSIGKKKSSISGKRLHENCQIVFVKYYMRHLWTLLW